MTIPTPTPDSPPIPQAELDAYVADVERIFGPRPGPEVTARLRDAVTTAQEHTEAVEHAAALLAAADHVYPAQRLLDTWQAFGAEPDEDVRALPPEPPLMGAVEVVSSGLRYQRLHGNTWICYGHDPVRWPDLIRLAGPAGVRVVKGGE